MENAFITFGEIMLRLKSPGYERLMQSNMLESTFGGGEANVAVSLSQFGLTTRYVTLLPDNDIGRACTAELMKFGVDTSCVAFTPGRIGIYFLEAGANQRPSKVIYDRDNSCIAVAAAGCIKWEGVFLDGKWCHITGITPAISDSAARLSIEAARAAKKAGLTVSCDLNYRKNLWKYGKKAPEVMDELVKYVDVIIANEEDIQKALDIQYQSDVESGELDSQTYEELARRVVQRYPNVKKVAITLRESKSASHNDWSACLYCDGKFLVSEKYEIKDIVDRVGGGDSFSAGFIYGLNKYADDAMALEFAVAASCLKHSIIGDFNRVSVQEVELLMGGNASGRISR